LAVVYSSSGEVFVTGVAVRVVLVMSAFALLVAGCSHVDKPLAKESEHLRPLAVLYGKYIASHMGQPPADEKVFRDFIKTLPANELESYGATNVDAIFTSTRDNKPYVILYNASSANPGEAAVVAYEQEGALGKRYVATSLGEVKLVELAELQKLVPNAK
jgi:hypothetical protein